MAESVNTELWKQYNGKGFAAEYAEYSERANKDVNGNTIVDTYATKDVATTSAAGLMSATDKERLNGMETGAEANTIESISANGTVLEPDDNKNVNITASQVGAEPAFSVLPIAKGGTGGTTQKAAAYNIFANILTINEQISDTSEWVQGTGNPSATLGPFCRNKITRVWEYIQRKISSDLGLTATEYGGDAASASSAKSGSALDTAINTRVPATTINVSVPGSSTRYVKMVVPDNLHHYLIFFNATMGDLHAEWLFRSYGAGGTARTTVNYIGAPVSTRKWYVAGTSGNTFYIEFENTSTGAQNLGFKVCSLDISALPTLTVESSVPSEYVEQPILGTNASCLLNPRKLAVSLSNTSTDTSFNGQADVTNIKTTGTLDIANGGTGSTTIKGALSNLTSETQHYDTLPTDDTLIVHKFDTATAGNGALYTRKLSYLWSYIQSKISSVLGLSDSGYGGNAATATHLSAYGTCDTWDSLPSYEYAIIAKTTFDIGSTNNGDGSLIQLEFCNSDLVKLKMDFVSKTEPAPEVRTARVLVLESTQPLSWIKENIIITYSTTTTDTVNICIYVHFDGPYQVWRARQLDCQTGDMGYTNWRPWTFYQTHGSDQPRPLGTRATYVLASHIISTARAYFDGTTGYKKLVKIVPDMTSADDRIIKFSAIQSWAQNLPKTYEGVIDVRYGSPWGWHYQRETKFSSVAGNIVLWYNDTTHEAYLVAKGEGTDSGFNLRIEDCMSLDGCDESGILTEFYDDASIETSIPSGFSELTGE